MPRAEDSGSGPARERGDGGYGNGDGGDVPVSSDPSGGNGTGEARKVTLRGRGGGGETAGSSTDGAVEHDEVMTTPVHVTRLPVA